MIKTKQYVQSQLNLDPDQLLFGPLLVIVHFSIPFPVSQPNSRRKLHHLRPHDCKPDGDNLEKFLNDALNQTLWRDDACISWLLRSKSWTKEKKGKTSIFVCELSNSVPDYEEIMNHIREYIQIDKEESLIP